MRAEAHMGREFWAYHHVHFAAYQRPLQNKLLYILCLLVPALTVEVQEYGNVRKAVSVVLAEGIQPIQKKTPTSLGSIHSTYLMCFLFYFISEVSLRILGWICCSTENERIRCTICQFVILRNVHPPALREKCVFFFSLALLLCENQ